MIFIRRALETPKGFKRAAVAHKFVPKRHGNARFGELARLKKIKRGKSPVVVLM